MAHETASARDRILATAHDLFYRDGVRATGVDRLIAEAGVTKVTFYRHFPSKDDLVRAFLDERHRRWMRWFEEALARHRDAQSAARRRSDPLAPVALALADWFAEPSFRGCAFINSLAEIGDAQPETRETAARHKDEMTSAIEALLPLDMRARSAIAGAAALAVDGAIVRAQSGRARSDGAVESLRLALAALTRAGSKE